MPLAWIWLAVTPPAATMPATPAMPPRPLTLEVARDPGWITVRVIGSSQMAARVHYALTVTGRSATRHTGRSVVGPGPATLSTVRFAGDRGWRVRLEVDGGSPAAYVVERSSDDP